MSGERSLKVDYLARVEGEGGMEIKIRDGEVSDVFFKIFEPPRFFEAFLQGRDYSEAPDITSRICGICPIAYQMSAVHAMEDALGVTVGGQLRQLRRLIYCGEWIESHALHVYLLHTPDFLGYQDAIRMAADHGEAVKQGLQLKKIGNELMAVMGGRSVHPINVRVGGFYRVPTKKELEPIREKLKWALEASIKTVELTAGLPFPDFERDYEFVALSHPDEYGMNEGRLVSNKGLDIAISEYEDRFTESHVAHTNALHSVLNERGAYHVGPLARFNLNYDKLTPAARQSAEAAGFKPTCNNPFKSIIARSVELVYACEEAINIIDAYEQPQNSYVDIIPHAGRGSGCTEAPRGILYHRYTLDQKGDIVNAKITPPTAQNQKTIEQDLTEYVPSRIDLPEEDLTWQCEQAIRNYDPCISCSTHFLKVKIDRE